jgi:hypothetical protein
MEAAADYEQRYVNVQRELDYTKLQYGEHTVTVADPPSLAAVIDLLPS